MHSDRIISSLCYFSVLFAPFLLPIVVYFVTEDYETKRHAKASLLSHLVPVISIFLYFFVFLGAAASGSEWIGGIAVVGGMLLLLGVNAAVFIWNLVKGIKLLT
ncbi:hypothetical protein GKZ89_10155 [Bacillus mangrovi]|uniref:DUF4870 domain-containing protein n=1 Tax=Metabacillus mangrovi TaxID=1491830 RepID=A0A7X2S5H0_9BACI|nr:DUF4870 domain-containing protein [Metabacillus mangrovi]MTH53767.1 hypothetical protein [Metabacillus mangrovi]